MFLWWSRVIWSSHPVNSVRLEELGESLHCPLSVILSLGPVLAVQLDGGKAVDGWQPGHLVDRGVNLTNKIVRKLLTELLPN